MKSESDLFVPALLFLTMGQFAMSAEFTPAPQKFRQEGAIFAEGEELARQPVQLIESSGGGVVRAFSAGRWHELHDGYWRINESLSPRNDSQFAFANSAGQREEAPVPWREVKQLLSFGTRD